MRRFLHFSALCLAVGLGSACRPEEVIETEDIPTAGIRFINAVPDTFGMDFRPVDIVENSTFYGVVFRNTTLLFYKNARAGERHFKIFTAVPSASLPSDVQQAIASTVIADINVTLEAGKLYTFILWGYARTGSAPAMKLTVLEDSPADPGTQVALRVVNAASGLAALDVFQYPNGGVVPGTPTWAGVETLTASSYINAPAGQIRFRVTPSGGGAALFTDPLALQGAAGTVDLEALPGTTVPGSAVSGFVVPRSVAGSPAANITTPGIIFAWDRRPPRSPGQ